MARLVVREPKGEVKKETMGLLRNFAAEIDAWGKEIEQGTISPFIALNLIRNPASQ
ncbi:MAG: hypothetical protein M1504_00845 [Candidatus Marsarchaeota archaeon]|nr:hypothetical protein [Candidatus Marsarchaeota archaeon]